MNEALRLPYGRFYTPLPMVESEQEVETCHRQLTERLDKPERKLVLRIIDTQKLMIGECSEDSFIYGFRLAWELTNELNHYLEACPDPEEFSGSGALGQFDGNRLNHSCSKDSYFLNGQQIPAAVRFAAWS